MKNFSYNQAGIAFTLALAFVTIPSVTSAATLYRELELGMRGADVSTLQTFLAQDNTIYPQGLVTSYFGSLTKSAVSNFQSRNGIATVGRVGPQTLPVINNQMINGMYGFNGVNSSNNVRVIDQISLNAFNNQATIAWTTSEGSISSIYYSSSPLNITEAVDLPVNISGGYNLIVNNDFRTSHSGNITGLSPNTRYYYVIYVRDAQGNESITWPSYFQTSN